MAATNYPWTDKDGVWRRNLGSMESFYLALASPEGWPVHWMIGCCVSIAYKGDPLDISQALLQAWTSLRSEFPNVAATVDPETKQIVVQIEGGEKEWLERSFKVHESGTAIASFEGFRSQSCITLHYLQATNELLVQAPHSLIDGRGILYLYHALFTALSKQSDSHTNGNGHLESKTPNLTRPYDDWLDVSPVPTEKNGKDAQSLFFRVLSQQNPIRLPDVDFGLTPGKPTHRELLLDETTTQTIISGCKKLGVSVTSAWHAALALTVQKIQAASGEPAGTTYTQFTTIDLRRHFPAPFSALKNSIGSLQTALPFSATLPADATDFPTLAHSLHAQYRAPFAFAVSDTSPSPDFGFLTPYMATSRQLLAAGAIPPSSTPSLSSMGRVADVLRESYGKWDLTGFWVSSTMMTGDFQMYCWTFRGRLAFSVCWNEAFYSTELVDRVMQGTREELLAGLRDV